MAPYVRTSKIKEEYALGVILAHKVGEAITNKKNDV
jgi:hypothetical protein